MSELQNFYQVAFSFIILALAKKFKMIWVERAIF